MNNFSTTFPHYNLLSYNNLNKKFIKTTIPMIINGGKNGNNSK